MECHKGTHKRKEPIMSDMAQKIGELKGKAEAKLDELKKDHEDQSK